MAKMAKNATTNRGLCASSMCTFSVVMMPALEILMLCCSIASWILQTQKQRIGIYAAHQINMPKTKNKRAPRSVLVVHFVKLVNQAHTMVGQHQRATLERPLLRHWVRAHRGSKTDSRGTLARRVDRPVRSLFDVFEEL